MQRFRVQPVLREPNGKQTWLTTAGGLLQTRGLLTGSRRLVLSGRQRRAGEDGGGAGWLEAEGMRGGGWWRGRSARATQVSVVKFPEELLVLHRQTLVHLWLLLERFLQRRLFCRQLSVTHQQHRTHLHSEIQTIKSSFQKTSLTGLAGWEEELLPALRTSNLQLLL